MMSEDVPRNSFGVTGLFSCIASCFDAQGEDVSPVILRGLWKNLFMFTACMYALRSQRVQGDKRRRVERVAELYREWNVSTTTC